MANKNKKIAGIILITLLGFILLYLVWTYYDAQLNDIDTTIKKLNDN